MAGFKPAPWLAAVLGLLVTPLGMLYVQRPWLAAGYFLAKVSAGLAAFFAMWLFGNQFPEIALVATGWAIAIACAVHAFRIARDGPAASERKWYSRWYGLACFPVVVLTMLFLFRAFVYEPFRKPSQSMHPTIPAGSIIFIQKSGFGHYGAYGISLRRAEPTKILERGDIVVHELVIDPSTSYVGRVVALPGDHIQYLDRQLIINGETMPVQMGHEDGAYQYAVERLDGREITVAFIPERPPLNFDQVVPPDQYAIFGDNRDNARDSRLMGLVPRKNIVGRVVKTLPPRQRSPE